jgi:hypothetical protein
MPVVRNPQYNFREGFCWTNVLNPQARLLKAKMKTKTVNDVGSMSLCSLMNDLVPNYYLVILLNSDLLFNYYREYINCTVNIQINDIRQLPIIIPSKEQLTEYRPLYEQIVNLKKQSLQTTKEDAIFKIEKIELELNKYVGKLYKFI